MIIFRRLCYALWLLISVFLFILDDNVWTLIIMVASVLLPAVSVLSAYLASRKVSINLSCSGVCLKNAPLHGEAEITNGSVFPVIRLNFSVYFFNVHNGEREKLHIGASLGSKENKTVIFDYSSAYAGKITVSAEDISLLDFLGIAGFGIPSVNIKSGVITVEPDICDCALVVTEVASPLSDSEVYSVKKSGNDPGEIFAIREYVPGDPIKNIHWKISQKVGNLMVKELGLPTGNDTLILFDTVFRTPSDRPSKLNIDAMTDFTSSVMQALVMGEYSFVFACPVRKQDGIFPADVSVTDEQTNNFAINTMLSCGFIYVDGNTEDIYRRCLNEKHYRHIVVITAGNEDFSFLDDNARINVVSFSDRIQKGLSTYNTVTDYKNFKGILNGYEI